MTTNHVASEDENTTTFSNLTEDEIAAFTPQGNNTRESDCEAMADGLICTLDSGHDGPHEAWGTVNLWHVWKEV